MTEPIFLATPDLKVKGNIVLTAYEPGSGDTLAHRSVCPRGQMIIMEKMLSSLRGVLDPPREGYWVPHHGYHA